MRKRTAIIILLVALVLVTADALVTNFLISRTLPGYEIEMNPLLKGIAGSNWLVVLKSGWVILFLIIIVLIKDRRVKGLR